jgi:excisionase family DNA binding protein
MNVIEAAEALKVHPKTVERLINEGIIPAAKVGRAWVMMTVHVMKYLEDQIIKQTAERRGVPLPASAGGRRRGRRGTDSYPDR